MHAVIMLGELAAYSLTNEWVRDRIALKLITSSLTRVVVLTRQVTFVHCADDATKREVMAEDHRRPQDASKRRLRASWGLL